MAIGLAAGAMASCSGPSAAPRPGARRPGPAARVVDVAVVADSEVPDEVIAGLDRRREIAVSSRVARPGWRIDQLDRSLDRALASHPDVLVYSAGANDLMLRGIGGMLGALRVRLDRAKASTCLVYIVPAVDTASMAEPQRSQVDRLIAAFSRVVADWQVRAVPYRRVADTMAAGGDRFFAAGELGSFHPGRAAYGRIVTAIAQEIATCP